MTVKRKAIYREEPKKHARQTNDLAVGRGGRGGRLEGVALGGRPRIPRSSALRELHRKVTAHYPDSPGYLTHSLIPIDLLLWAVLVDADVVLKLWR